LDRPATQHPPNGLESGCRAPRDATGLHCDGQRTPCMDGARRGASLLCHAELYTLVRSLPPPTWRALRPTVNVQTQPYRFTLWHSALSTAPVCPILGPSHGAHAPVPRVGIYSRSIQSLPGSRASKVPSRPARWLIARARVSGTVLPRAVCAAAATGSAVVCNGDVSCKDVHVVLQPPS